MNINSRLRAKTKTIVWEIMILYRSVRHAVMIIKGFCRCAFIHGPKFTAATDSFSVSVLPTASKRPVCNHQPVRLKMHKNTKAAQPISSSQEYAPTAGLVLHIRSTDLPGLLYRWQVCFSARGNARLTMDTSLWWLTSVGGFLICWGKNIWGQTSEKHSISPLPLSSARHLCID